MKETADGRRALFVPRWIARVGLLLIFVVAIPIGHGVLPWALSALTLRHGWTGGAPAAWNLLGLAPLALGIALLAWVAIVAMHNVPARVRLGPAADYLVTDGPYRRTRNPMYVAELSLWLGWTVLLGSVAVALGLVALLVIIAVLLVPWEERSLRRRVGDRYRVYEADTPRWFRWHTHSRRE